MIATMAATGSGTVPEEENLSAAAERFCRRFSLAEIRSATQDFSEASLVGQGGFGKVYKGLTDNGLQTVAIKRLAPNSNQGEGEFLMEIETLSKLRHVNLVSLIGYCNRNGEMILVYEYIPRGTLAGHLYRVSRDSESDEYFSSLTWKQRLNICIGAARGIDYLHTGTSIIHRDVKSTNILLDENFTAKVSDFGLAKPLNNSSSNSYVSTVVKGSFGYLDPSYFITCKLTQKSDTYSFGVVLFEVLCGRPALDPRLGEDQMSLATWALEKITKGKSDQIVASDLRDQISADCLKTFVGTAKRCLNYEPKKRPTMAQVVVQLQFALQQQDKRELTLNTSRLFLMSFWNRVKPSGIRTTASIQKVQKWADINMLPTAIYSLVDKLMPYSVAAIEIHELEESTNNFSSDCLISTDEYRGVVREEYRGGVYRGALKSGQVAAIRKLHYGSLPDKEFLQQVSLISSIKHENVVPLLGYCVYGGQQFLAYEFAPNGSLHDILHGKHGDNYGSKPVPVLSWAQRVEIATGAAKGLEYIHKRKQVHRNIRSSNVLLFDDCKIAKLGDFGRSTHYTDSLSAVHQRGYHPPEYGWFGELSWTSDVYSFGVVLVELLTGRKLDDDSRPKEQQNLLKWATPWLMNEKAEAVLDPKLEEDYPQKAVTEMARIAASCLQHKRKSRPDMSSVVRRLCPLLDDCSATETQTDEIFPSPET